MAAAFHESEQTTMRGILRFYWPLAATSVLMMASHSLGNSAMVKTADPELALAAFGVAQSLAMMFEGSVAMARQLGLARIKDRRSWVVITRLLTMVTASVVSIMLAIAFTPLGTFVFSHLMGAPADVAKDAVLVFRYFLIFPVVSCVRFTYHGLIILKKKTGFTTLGMLMRVSVMTVLTFYLTNNPPALGGAAGAIVILSGIGAEALVSALTGRTLVKDLEEKSDDRSPELTYASAFKFFFPLAISGIVTSLSRIGLSSGLARTIDPKTALAVYQVTWTIAWIFVNPITILHQVTVVFGDSDSGLKEVIRFARALAIGAACLLLAFVLTGSAAKVLTQWIGVAPNLIPACLWVIGLMMFLPLSTSWTEISMGRLLLTGDSVALGAGRTIYVIVLTLVVLTLAIVFPALGAAVAPVAMVVGSLAEATFLHLRVNKAARKMLQQEPRLYAEFSNRA